MRHSASFERFCVKIGLLVEPGRDPEKKKSHNMYMSPPPGGATADPIRAKLGSVGGPLEVITSTHFKLSRLRAGGGVRCVVLDLSITSTDDVNMA